jgi:hypothetical protein
MNAQQGGADNPFGGAADPFGQAAAGANPAGGQGGKDKEVTDVDFEEVK